MKSRTVAHCCPRGFTLLELVLALSIMSILLGAMTSVIVIMTRALPTRDSATARTVAASRVADRIAAELQEARSILKAEPTEVKFTVADRDDPPDGSDEIIHYGWSGNAGDPLVRLYNDGEPTIALAGVHEFALEYVSRTVTADQSAPTIESAEQLLLQQDSTNAGSGSQITIANNEKGSEYFHPALPAAALSWRITRAQANISPAGQSNGTVSVSVRPASGNNKPSGSMVDEVLVPESDFGNNQWYEIVFPNAGGLDPDTGYHVTFTADGGGQCGKLKIGTGSVSSPDTLFFYDSGGGTWTETPDQDIWLWVWGTWSLPDPDWVPPLGTELAASRVMINTGSDPDTRVRTAAPILNNVELP